jgi:hypothetical protein
MSFPYRYIIRGAAKRVSAITGTAVATVEANYITSPLTASQIGSVDFPFTSIKDAVISSVARLVRAYAFVPGHPFRNESQTASIAHKSVIPVIDSAGKEIVGVYGAIHDVTDGEILTEQPSQLIRSIRASDADLKEDYYYYKIVGKRLEHTRTGVVIDVVTFDEATERAAIDANGDCPLPDALLDAAFCGVVALLIIDDEYVAQASRQRRSRRIKRVFSLRLF